MEHKGSRSKPTKDANGVEYFNSHLKEGEVDNRTEFNQPWRLGHLWCNRKIMNYIDYNKQDMSK